MSSIHLSTYADLACANTCVYLGEKVRETVKQGDTEGGREVREGKGREGKGKGGRQIYRSRVTTS